MRGAMVIIHLKGLPLASGSKTNFIIGLIVVILSDQRIGSTKYE